MRVLLLEEHRAVESVMSDALTDRPEAVDIAVSLADPDADWLVDDGDEVFGGWG